MPSKRLLKSQDKKFRMLFEDHPQPMWILDRTGQQFLEVNAAARKLYGYSAAEFTHITPGDIQSPDDARRFLSLFHDQVRPAASEWRHRTKEGQWFEVEIALHEIQYGGDSAQLAVLMDITGRRNLEDQLRQAQKMEALGLLTGGVAHDFNNLLTIITGYSQLILGKLREDDPNRHSAEQIVKAAERAGELTRRLLLFSRRRVLQAKVLDLNDVVTSLSTMVQRLLGEEIELKLDLGAGLGSVHADSSRLEQVLLNLAANSRDAMPRGGTLTIETANVTVERPDGVVKPGSYVALNVKDTGEGMDSATQAHAFEPFFTTKGAGSGTGLGLYTVSGIVKQSGGAVELSSTLGGGTSFRIFLPRVDLAVAVEPDAPKLAAPRGAETILLVEDDDMVRSLVRETMESSGYHVLEASDPLDARTIAANYPGTIQLLITDVIMPKASGPELAKELLKTYRGLKVLYMSGHTERAISKRGIRRKEVAFLPKPFTPAALAAKVREVLESSGKTNHA
jgi:two-component system cell cycle sensor histidine kinase/response regulator CckA